MEGFGGMVSDEKNLIVAPEDAMPKISVNKTGGSVVPCKPSDPRDVDFRLRYCSSRSAVAGLDDGCGFTRGQVPVFFCFCFFVCFPQIFNSSGGFSVLPASALSCSRRS